jgi:hypothetical protein
MATESEIEIRPVFEMEDFGGALTPEIKAQEDRVRAGGGKAAASVTAPGSLTFVCLTHGEASAVRA